MWHCNTTFTTTPNLVLELKIQLEAEKQQQGEGGEEGGEAGGGGDSLMHWTVEAESPCVALI